MGVDLKLRLLHHNALVRNRQEIIIIIQRRPESTLVSSNRYHNRIASSSRSLTQAVRTPQSYQHPSTTPPSSTNPSTEAPTITNPHKLPTTPATQIALQPTLSADSNRSPISTSFSMWLKPCAKAAMATKSEEGTEEEQTAIKTTMPMLMGRF